MNNMKKYKSIVAVIVSLAVIIASTTIASAASVLQQTASSENDPAKAFEMLKAVGAMDPDEIFDAEMPVTRAHFVKMALHASNDAPKVLVSEDEVFYDVDMNTKYENYIETAYRIGYISGSSSGLFEPENNITLAQAVKILCNIMGYTQLAEANGGFPGGYLVVAHRIDLLDGIQTNDNEVLNMQTAIMLIYNAVHCNLMEVVSWGETITAGEYDDRTLLSERHRVDCVEGVIDANGYTDLYSRESELESGYVSVDSVTYFANNTNAQSYIGYRVKMYYDSSDGAKREVLYVEPTDENYVISASGKDISVGEKGIEVYLPDGDVKSVKLDSTVTCILNGKMAIVDYEDLQDVTKGEVCFISNNGDRTADIINITRYDTFRVQGVSVTSGAIVTYDGVKIELDPDDDNYTFEITKNSEPALISDIKPGDVVLLSEGSDSGFIHKKLLISDKTVSGVITELGDDTAVIDGVTYNVNGVNMSSLSAGKTFRVMLDALENISYAEFENDVVYGYLYGLAKTGMDNPKCRIFTENNRWVDLDFASKVRVNGQLLPAQEAYEALDPTGEFRQLIRYNVNADAEVVMIETAKSIKLGSGDSDGDGTDEELEAIQNDTFRLNYSGNIRYRNSPSSFNGEFFADAMLKVFVVPDDMSREKFRVRTKAKLINDKSYKIEAYDIDECLNCKVIVTNDTSNSDITSNSRFMLVKSIGLILDKEGNAVPSLKGWWKGNETTFSVKTGDEYVSTESLNALKKGDVINFSYDDDGNIISITTYSIDEKYYISGSLYSTCTIISGEVKEFDAELNRIKLEYAEGAYGGITYNPSLTMYLWDTQKETYTKTNASELMRGDKLVVNMRYLVCQDVIIIR